MEHLVELIDGGMKAQMRKPVERQMRDSDVNRRGKRVSVRRARLIESLLAIAAYLALPACDDRLLLPEDELAEKYRVFFDEVAQVMDYAAERNLELMLKPHTGLSATGKECVASAEKVNHPNFRIWYDPGNVSFYEGVRPEGDIVQVAKYMSGMCVKDHKGARAEANFPTPGDGDVDWVRIFSTLKDSGFDGPCIVETVGAKTAEEADVQAVRVREFLMRTLQEVGLEAE